MAVYQQFMLFIVLCAVPVQSVSVSLRGENVYSITYQSLQYFLFIADKEATITCSVSGTSQVPEISFKKEGKDLNTVLPESLYTIETETSNDGQTHSLKLRIDAMYTGGYTEIVGDWTCSVGIDGSTREEPFKTLCTNKPTLEFQPPLVEGVARHGTTITMSCNCGSLDEFEKDLKWSWFMDSTTPSTNKITYDGPRAEDGYPSKRLIYSDLDGLDSAAYRCTCIVEAIMISSHETHMSVMKPPGTPKDLSLFKDPTMDTLDVQWENDEDMGVVTGYQISYAEKSDSNDKPYKEVSMSNGSAKHHKITHLESSTTYNVKVAAFNHAGVGMYSVVASFTTSQPSESRPVIIAPMNYDLDKFGRYVVDVGEDVDISLHCKVKSNPKSIIQWVFNNREINTLDPGANDPNNYVISTPYDTTDFHDLRTLTIERSKGGNQGLYTCTAMNLKGTATQTYFLRVTINSVDKQTDGKSKSSAVLACGSIYTIILLTFFRTLLLS